MNGDTPQPKKRNWIAIVLGVLLLFGILGVGCVVITVSWFRQNLAVTGTSEEAAMQQMDEVRGRFLISNRSFNWSTANRSSSPSAPARRRRQRRSARCT